MAVNVNGKCFNLMKADTTPHCVIDFISFFLMLEIDTRRYIDTESLKWVLQSHSPVLESCLRQVEDTERTRGQDEPTETLYCAIIIF